VGGAAAGGQDDDVDAQRKIIINPKSKSPKKTKSRNIKQQQVRKPSISKAYDLENKNKQKAKPQEGAMKEK